MKPSLSWSLSWAWLAVAGPLAATPALAAAPVATACVADFANSVGVNTHLDAKVGQYGDLSQVIAALRFLGVERARDVAPRSPAGLAAEQAVAAAIPRLRYSLIVMDDPARAMPGIHTLAAHVGVVEGPNEVDRTPVRYQGLVGPAAVTAEQRAIRAAVLADPALNGQSGAQSGASARHTPVLNFSLARQEFGAYGDLSLGADLTNVHAYARKGVPPFWMLRPVIRHVTGFLDRPVVITETNYPTIIQPDGNGVSEPVQARWVLDTLLDAFRDGVRATYVYQLLDGVADPGGHTFEAHFGLFRSDGTPKLAATALRNLLAALRDQRACAATAAAPAYQVSLPSDAFDLLLARSDGSFVLALWAEPVIWDPAHNAQLPAPAVPRVVTFAARHDVRVYDPLLGARPIDERHDVDRIAVTLTDHPLLITLR